MQTKKVLLNLFIISILSIAFILIKPISINAQNHSINEGINWLLITQNPDGSWSEDPRTYLDTYTALKTLLLLDIDNAQVSQAISWVSDQDSTNTDDLSHKVLLLSMAGVDTSTEISTLLAFQSSDIGWGVDQDFSSEVIDTALALQALKSINHPDLETISYALGYLLSTQNEDGGWGFSPSTCSGCDDASAGSAQSSNVYMTALVSMTLQQFSLTTDLATAVNRATDYLIAHQNVDGGFPSTETSSEDIRPSSVEVPQSNSSGSTVCKTFLAFVAL